MARRPIARETIAEQIELTRTRLAQWIISYPTCDYQNPPHLFGPGYDHPSQPPSGLAPPNLLHKLLTWGNRGGFSAEAMGSGLLWRGKPVPKPKPDSGYRPFNLGERPLDWVLF